MCIYIYIIHVATFSTAFQKQKKTLPPPPPNKPLGKKNIFRQRPSLASWLIQSLASCPPSKAQKASPYPSLLAPPKRTYHQLRRMKCPSKIDKHDSKNHFSNLPRPATRTSWAWTCAWWGSSSSVPSAPSPGLRRLKPGSGESGASSFFLVVSPIEGFDRPNSFSWVF